MLMFGVNFNLYYFLLIRRFRDVFHSEELRSYLLIVAAAVVAITVDIAHLYDSVSTSLCHAFFQVSSIITRPDMPPRTSTPGRLSPREFWWC